MFQHFSFFTRYSSFKLSNLAICAALSLLEPVTISSTTSGDLPADVVDVKKMSKCTRITHHDCISHRVDICLIEVIWRAEFDDVECKTNCTGFRVDVQHCWYKCIRAEVVLIILFANTDYTFVARNMAPDLFTNLWRQFGKLSE